MAEPLATAPIGVFDSGIGGLSVLQALLQALPDEHFVYLADSGYAPYGERDQAQVLRRAEAIARYQKAEGDFLRKRASVLIAKDLR